MGFVLIPLPDIVKIVFLCMSASFVTKSYIVTVGGNVLYLYMIYRLHLKSIRSIHKDGFLAYQAPADLLILLMKYLSKVKRI